jgi:hypothetical protein
MQFTRSEPYIIFEDLDQENIIEEKKIQNDLIYIAIYIVKVSESLLNIESTLHINLMMKIKYF